MRRTHEMVAMSYGREELRLLGVRPGSSAHDARDLRLSMTLEGDFSAAFAEGDNSAVLPTRSMTNTAAALVHDHLGSCIERIAAAVAERLLLACPAAHVAQVAVTECPWARVSGSRHTFTAGPSDLWLTEARAQRGRPVTVASGASGLHRAVTTGSSFTDFLVDEYTLPHQVAAEDRVLHLSGELRWECGEPPDDYDALRAEVLGAFLGAAADQRSRSSQHSAYLSATAVLEACPLVSQVGVRFVHHAHAPVDLSPFGRGEPGSVWLSTDSSYGAGTVTVRRGTA
ncbi:hypothetical protein ACH427_01950 [Streptomyces sp. NPDC020379]|uniref:hypothetical protein n=1 Tax=Streptomyces sp. NPDC020379 TaxID=3365071 RepID=UPI00379B8053